MELFGEGILSLAGQTEKFRDQMKIFVGIIIVGKFIKFIVYIYLSELFIYLIYLN